MLGRQAGRPGVDEQEYEGTQSDNGQKTMSATATAKGLGGGAYVCAPG